MGRNSVEKEGHRFEELLSDFFRKVRLGNPSKFSDIPVTEMQFLALAYLDRMQNCTMGQLKNCLDVSLSTLTGVMDRMVRDGYVERNRDDEDRRLVKVRLTKKGKETAKKLQKLKHERVIAILKLLDVKERSLLISTFDKLVHAISKRLKEKGDEGGSL